MSYRQEPFFNLRDVLFVLSLIFALIAVTSLVEPGSGAKPKIPQIVIGSQADVEFININTLAAGTSTAAIHIEHTENAEACLASGTRFFSQVGTHKIDSTKSILCIPAPVEKGPYKLDLFLDFGFSGSDSETITGFTDLAECEAAGDYWKRHAAKQKADYTKSTYCSRV